MLMHQDVKHLFPCPEIFTVFKVLPVLSVTIIWADENFAGKLYNSCCVIIWIRNILLSEADAI